VKFLLCGGSNEGHSFVLISIKCIGAFCLYVCTDTFSNDNVHRWEREGRGYSEWEREGDIEWGREGKMQDRGKGGNIGREGEGRRKRLREGMRIKFTFSMFKEDIFSDRITFPYFVSPDWDFLYSWVKKNNDIVKKQFFF